MSLEKHYEGKFEAQVNVEGVVARNASAVVVEVGQSYWADDFIAVTGSSKRNVGEPYNAEVGANLALADAFEQAAAIIRTVYTPE